jgi:hypothetical protein
MCSGSSVGDDVVVLVVDEGAGLLVSRLLRSMARMSVQPACVMIGGEWMTRLGVGRRQVTRGTTAQRPGLQNSCR